MAAIDLSELERRARRKYELARATRALLGFAPAWLVVAVASLLNHHAQTALILGSVMFAAGVGLLWYGRELRRAVLPGLGMGMLPLACALCANMMGHACLADRCMALCVPACTVGGLGAGLGISIVALRRQAGPGFWLGASTLALLTGAMGCSCVGYGGIAGLAAGYVAGVAPALIRRGLARG